MTAHEVVEYCRETGIEMVLERGLLYLRPRALVSEELARAVHQHKPALIRLLERRLATDAYPLHEVWVSWETYKRWSDPRPESKAKQARSHYAA